MKTYKKVLLIVALLLVVGGGYATYRIYNVQKSYYPMAGEVTIIDKSQSGNEHYIVIEEATGEQFTLSCSASDYDGVNVGDMSSGQGRILCRSPSRSTGMTEV